MIDVNKLKKGVTFELEGEPYRVLEYRFTKMARGTGNVKVKVNNLITKAVLNKTFTTGRFVKPIDLIKKKMQYLYKEGENYVFMDPKSFEQMEIKKDLLKDEADFLIEGMEVDVLFWEEQALAVELPPKMEYKVKETGPGEKGDSATNIYKSAVLENGLKVKIPLFIKIGEMVKVDTRTGEYIERA